MACVLCIEKGPESKDDTICLTEAQGVALYLHIHKIAKLRNSSAKFLNFRM